MPKSVTPKRIIKALIAHGFVLKRIRGSHHLFQHPETKRRALVPLHSKDLPKGTVNDILNNSGLSFEDM